MATVGRVTDLAMLPVPVPLGRLAAATPSPSPSDLIDQGVQEVNRFWEWFTGWPLHVLLILAIGLLVLFLVRRAIHHVAEHIAKGYHRSYTEAVSTVTAPGAGDPAEAGRGGRRAKVKAVLVEDTLGVTPEVRQRRAQRARTVGSVLGSAANIIIFTVMGLMILTAVGAAEVVGPLLASAGVVGVALGFGAQSLVRDFLSGIFILIEDQFGVGDIVDLGFGVNGTVERMDLRLTHVRSFDGTLWHVRNGEILRAGNHTQQWARVVAQVKVPVGSDIDQVRAALGRAVDTVSARDGVGADLLEPLSVRGVDELTDGAYTFTIHGRVRPGADGPLAPALLEQAQLELVRASIIMTAGTDSSPEELKPDEG